MTRDRCARWNRGPARLMLSMGLLLMAWGAAVADSARWYTSAQVEQGARVFAQHCAECHGDRAGGAADWTKPGPEGKYPPPPLNGTAHAWHHPLDMLRRVIRRGGQPVGGVMPAFSDKLSAEQIDAAIAYFQSLWSDQIYEAWASRHAAGALPSAATPAGNRDPVTANLRRLVPDVGIPSPEPTPVSGVLQVKLGKRYAYVTSDGRYAFVGDLLDLKDGTNLTAAERKRDTLARMETFPEQAMVIYPAEGERKALLRVFTDSTCPYCRKLHREVPTLQRAGVAVAYIPFPRAGQQGQGYRDMRAVWCAENRRRALDIATGVQPGELGATDCPSARAVDRGYDLGRELGIQGTPAIVLPDGGILSGYRPAAELASLARSDGSPDNPAEAAVGKP